MAPQRPRSHVLETANQRAFLNAIPAEWTDSTPTVDYGIDLRIEIFTAPDSSGACAPTGEEFGVQLKATDGEETGDRSVGIKWDTYEYWRSLAYPVLVVRYLASTDQLFAMWAHERGAHADDGHLKRAWFRFEAHHEIGDDFESETRTETASFRAAISRDLGFPLELFVAEDTPTPWLVRSNADLAGLLGDNRIRLRVGTGSPRLRLRGDRLELSLGAGFGVVVHGKVERTNVRPEDLSLLAGICLARVRAGDDAERCIDSARDSVLLRDPRVLAMAAFALISCNRLELALEMVLRQADSDPPVAEHLLTIARLANLAEHPTAGPLAKEIAARLVSGAEDDTGRAIALYNQANLLRTLHDHEAAVVALRECHSLNTGYGDRQYFWADLAGSLFLSDEKAEAAAAYERARELGPESAGLRQRRLDAMFEVGRYADVAEEIAAITDPSSDEVLLGIATNAIVQRFGIENQVRDPDGLRAAAKADPDLPSAKFAEFDATDAGVWALHMRERAGEANDLETALTAIIVARLAPYEHSSWAGAIVYSYATHLPADIRSAVVDRAFFSCGPTLARDVADAVEATGLQEFDPAAADDLFRDIADLKDSKPEGLVIRDARSGDVTHLIS